MLSSSVGELIATGTVSFLLGWAFKSNGLTQIVRNIKSINKNLPLDNVKMVVVVRSDLPMNKGKIAAQCSHAVLACYKHGMTVNPHLVKKWESQGQTKVILKTSSGEEGLKQLAKNAAEVGLVAALIRDAGRTQIPSGTATVLGIGPDSVTRVDKITSHLKLL